MRVEPCLKVLRAADEGEAGAIDDDGSFLSRPTGAVVFFRVKDTVLSRDGSQQAI